MIFQETILVIAILSMLVPIVAVFFRGHYRHIMMFVAWATAISVSFYLYSVFRLIEIGAEFQSPGWIYAIFISGILFLLSGFVLSACFGRDNLRLSLATARRTLVFLAFLGLIFVCLLRHRYFVIAYNWVDGGGTIYLGSVGKAYLSYLMIGMVFIGHNLEKLYRLSPAEARYRLRLPLLGFITLLGYFTFVLATGMLYASIGTSKLVVSGLPIIFISLFVAYGYMRGSLTDVATPVSRNIVYSSITALAAGVFIIAIVIATQVASLTNWSPDTILIAAASLIVILLAALLLLSNRFKRLVRSYIDRNFFVNRYDYRTQWSNLTEALETATDRSNLLNNVTGFLQDVFAPTSVTISLRDNPTLTIRPVRGKGKCSRPEVLMPDSPLYQHLSIERKTLYLDRKPDDLTYVSIYAENDEWLEATASILVAPLIVDGELSGTIGLEREKEGDNFTFEDVALLDSISAHVSAALHSLRLARELTETRETELMSQLSSMLLHDLKNYLTPLRMVASNLIEFNDNPDINEICSRDISHVTDRMEKLAHTLSELRANPQLMMKRINTNEIVTEAISDLKLSDNPSIELKLDLVAEQSIIGDKDMLLRVLENLITNAVDAMKGTGILTISSSDYHDNGRPQVHINVADTGGGIPEDFLREKLFRPFATTKTKGLGLGLYQSRTIVQVHGGDLSVGNRIGEGADFQIMLLAATPEPETGSVPVMKGNE